MVEEGAVRVAQYIAALILLVAWLPASSHCLLGAAGMMPNSCCCEEAHGHDGKSMPAGGDDDCGTCSTIESGLYKIRAPDNFVFPFHATLTVDLIQSSPLMVALNATPHLSGRAPPSLAVRWQFQTRAALPGRAPAIF
jgi:hypothetical protein